MSVGFPVENLLLNRRSGENLSRQLYRQMRRLIEARILPSGSALPSTRTLARDVDIGRNTVIAAYEQLALEGFVTLGHRTPPIVSGLPALSSSTSTETKQGKAKQHPNLL